MNYLISLFFVILVLFLAYKYRRKFLKHKKLIIIKNNENLKKYKYK